MSGGWASRPRHDNQRIQYDSFTLKINHDAAGNMTYDGQMIFAYDAWNRLVSVAKVYQDGGSTDGDGDGSNADPEQGSVLMTAEYDGMGRRTVKAVTNSEDLDATYHYYYDGQRCIEVRNGSDAVLYQHVWGQLYIDELVQKYVNGDPVDDPDFDSTDPDHDPRNYYALEDAHFNVIGLVDSNGDLVERYEYDPYGQRQVYVPTGPSDPFGLAPIAMSTRVDIGGVDQPYGLNDIGHQGLMHDEHVGLICNRARYLHPRVGRFLNRDRLEYISGMNQFEYCKSRPNFYLDPSGHSVIMPGDPGFDGGLGNNKDGQGVSICCPITAGTSNEAELCKLLLKAIKTLANKIAFKISKYDPISDGAGGHDTWGGGTTSSGGHYREIKRLQQSLNEKIRRYNDRCRDPNCPQGVPVPVGPGRLANQYVPPPLTPIVPTPPESLLPPGNGIGVPPIVPIPPVVPKPNWPRWPNLKPMPVPILPPIIPEFFFPDYNPNPPRQPEYA